MPYYPRFYGRNVCSQEEEAILESLNSVITFFSFSFFFSKILGARTGSEYGIIGGGGGGGKRIAQDRLACLTLPCSIALSAVLLSAALGRLGLAFCCHASKWALYLLLHLGAKYNPAIIVF